MPILFAKTDKQLERPKQCSAVPVPTDGRGDFDFLVGSWNVSHRRLQQRLANDTRWEEFRGMCDCRPIIGGLGNIDDNVLELPAGPYRAATLRVFDPAVGLWSIWWVDSRTPRLEPPVCGRFENGIGTFFGDDVLDDGRPVRVRFTWSEIAGHSACWDQALSADGTTWEHNWTMRFERAA